MRNDSDKIQLSRDNLLAMLRTSYLEGFKDGITHPHEKDEDRWLLSSVYRNLLKLFY